MLPRVGLVVLVAVVAACNNPRPAASVSVQLISAPDAAQFIAQNQGNPDFVILDVRTPGEFAQGHLENAVNVDYLDAGFAAAIGAMPTQRTYLVYCGSGGRSAQACDAMLVSGFESIYDLDGGFSAWDGAGLPWTTN